MRYPCEDRLAGEGVDKTHDFVYIRGGPEFQGWPDVRHRFAGALMNRRTTVWTGPRGKALEQDFSKRFWRSIQMPGSSLLVEDDDARWKEYARMAGGKWSEDSAWSSVAVEELKKWRSGSS